MIAPPTLRSLDRVSQSWAGASHAVIRATGRRQHPRIAIQKVKSSVKKFMEQASGPHCPDVLARCAVRPRVWVYATKIINCPQKGDLRLLGPPSGQSAGSGARTRDRGVPADLRADSLATLPPTHPVINIIIDCLPHITQYP
ncbi:hypothetical protein PoB_000525500 [Plakobranchus ocellatus]|uniref:Uncharacterized protein n=1 Tax=Plakobranchus ocellatus TaxID=259542 RepID=A0AAV3Y7H5_9GAST|nr:hypothetical protein PoB_000525500 [Plakobranchus ocellatus]